MALRFFALFAVLGVTYFLDKKRRASHGPHNGGMKVGHDSRTIDLTPKYGDNGDRDIVEQASWESFPASDPPAY